MSGASKGDSVPEDNNNELKPDYFGYYTRQVADFFSEDDDDSLPCSSTKCITEKQNSNPLFNNSIQLSDISKERLKVFLRQSVVAFTGEVDEITDSVISIRHLLYCLKNKTSVLDDLNERPAKKKLRASSSSSSPSLLVDESQQVSCTNSVESSRDEDKDVAGVFDVEANEEEDMRILLTTDGSEVEETTKKYSDELSQNLYYMEQKLEELLDIVTSNCRSMTQLEKVKLRRIIQNLPPRNLDRVAEIIRRGSKSLQNLPSDEINVDLDDEDNVTLWRLYYYAETFENAKKLCVG
jgi:hypothetical protein